MHFISAVVLAVMLHCVFHHSLCYLSSFVCSISIYWCAIFFILFLLPRFVWITFTNLVLKNKTISVELNVFFIFFRHYSVAVVFKTRRWYDSWAYSRKFVYLGFYSNIDGELFNPFVTRGILLCSWRVPNIINQVINLQYFLEIMKCSIQKL